MKNENSQNEPGMCLGINTFTFWCGPQTRSPRLAHIAKGAMYAPPEAGLGCASAQPLGTKPECGLESTVSQIALLSRIDGARANEMRRPAAAVQRRDWVAHTWRCLPCVRREAGLP